tara:strand:+ start:553 stop:1590 length:1038 start_codon:yes stop_codon:yes gene_type:complete
MDSQNKLSYIFQKAYNIGFASVERTCKSDKLLALIKQEVFPKKMQDKIEYITAFIDFRKLVPHLEEKGTKFANYNEKDKEKELENITSYFCCGKNLEIFEQPLVDRLNDLCKKGKIIFINMGIDSYFVNRYAEGNYAIHGTCAILIPNGNDYNMYYINSHGHDVLYNTNFETVKTKTRINTIKFTCPVDCIVMKAICDYMKINHDINIHYDSTEKHNYYGVNLQEGDDHGVCYIFPIVIYYYFGIYFTEKKALRIDGKVRYVKTFQNLLKSNNIDLMVHVCFADFDTEITKILFDSLHKKKTEKNSTATIELLTKSVNNSKFRFVKNITNTIISFISQAYFMKKI